MNQQRTDVDDDKIEVFARFLAKQAKERRTRALGYHEQDDFGDALAWLGYTDEATQLIKDGAMIIRGQLII
jgi:pyruvate-formate lyase-activating enzyme